MINCLIKSTYPTELIFPSKTPQKMIAPNHLFDTNLKPKKQTGISQLITFNLNKSFLRRKKKGKMFGWIQLYNPINVTNQIDISLSLLKLVASEYYGKVTFIPHYNDDVRQMGTLLQETPFIYCFVEYLIELPKNKLIPEEFC